MKKLLFLVLISLAFVACSSDDSPTILEEETNASLKLYKRTNSYYDGVLSSTQEVFYNSENKIESVTLNEVDYLNRTFTVNYTNGNVSGITSYTDVINPNGIDETINYNDITLTNNTIILISDASDRTLEIEFSNGYVNSTKFYPTSMPSSLFEQIFTRNSNNQLISNTTGFDSFEYSDFDADKQLDPYGSVMEYEHSTFFMIFGLEVSRDNPLTATYNGNNGETYSNFLEYDEQGYVTKVSYDSSNSNSNYSEHQYITE
ncbi:hypothetical protein [Dokdonia sp. PRO95]|uniref:hypothetical protein n=1 Tax=Dokdonia sp. PRO95 TaxID=1239415 RepID=UPI00054D1EB2|nr:hypothetical protein [Dokdonia sp. PRO95]